MTFQYKLPHEQFPGLFEDVQLSGIFEDSKTFVDSIPMADPEEILYAYRKAQKTGVHALRQFVLDHFEVPGQQGASPDSDTTLSTGAHIRKLWPWLKRDGLEDDAKGSLLPLRHPYVVPGGRFREIYYWDSYFTMLGLAVSGESSLVASMVRNFADQVDLVGHIPNGNRTYFLSRSQPPFFSLMVRLLAEYEGNRVPDTFAGQLRREYDFWMSGSRKVVLDDGCVLNRYSDNLEIPRAESYAEDVELAEGLSELQKKKLFREIRAACESGWDFSSRWMIDPEDLSSIRTTDILPVDLNCLLLDLERLLASICIGNGDQTGRLHFEQAVEDRIHAIQKYFWDEASGTFCDYRLSGGSTTGIISMATMFPLFFEVGLGSQADRVVRAISSQLFKPGGWMTTAIHSGQQWDAPNGWAPLQWIAYKGLANYGYSDLARQGAARWLALNDKVFSATGKMMEKYNVEDLTLEAGGGEYPVQDGFGWTNGVYLALHDALRV